VVCSEDWPKITPEARQAETQATFAGEALFESRWKPCEYWPKAELPADYYEPVKSDKPVLIFSGGLDPVTPPSWGELAAQTLPNSRHIVAEYAAHGVSPLGCGPRLVEEFLETADASAVDADCVNKLRRPAFLLSPVATAAPQEDEP
jgi:pimeloyl-ACP methyl ester carboxylesterase